MADAVEITIKFRADPNEGSWDWAGPIIGTDWFPDHAEMLLHVAADHPLSERQRGRLSQLLWDLGDLMGYAGANDPEWEESGDRGSRLVFTLDPAAAQADHDMMMSPRHEAQRGEQLLRSAVLELLVAAAPRAMTRGQIHVAAGVTTSRDPNAPHSLIKGVLNLLRDDGLVCQEGGARSGWRLTRDGRRQAEANRPEG